MHCASYELIGIAHFGFRNWSRSSKARFNEALTNSKPSSFTSHTAGEHDGLPVRGTKPGGPITLESHQHEETRSGSALQPLVNSDNPDNDGKKWQLTLKQVLIALSAQSEKQIQCIDVKY